MRDTDPQKKPHAPRWMRITLVISLAFNLLIAGLALGAGMAKDKWRHHDMGALGAMTRALEDQDRQALRQEIRKSFASKEAMRQARNDRTQALLEALRTTPFNPDLLRTRLAEIGAPFTEGMERGQAFVAERLISMSPEARTAYADRLEDVLRRRDRHH